MVSLDLKHVLVVRNRIDCFAMAHTHSFSPWRQRLRTLHRGLAVAAGVYFLAMAVSGVLLNHPDWLRNIDVPRSWVPGDYLYRNGNRGALRGLVDDPGQARYLYGEAGVWRRGPGGDWESAMTGFPRGAYDRDTRALLAVAGPQPYLLAGTRSGLWARPLAGGAEAQWRAVPLPGAEAAPTVVDLLTAGGRVLAVTRSQVVAAVPSWPPEFSVLTLPRAVEAEPRLPLFRLLFHAHSGQAWGLPGRLVVDAVGVALVGFTLTGLWFWWRRRRGAVARGRLARYCRRGLRWHLRWGMWCAVPLLLVALTGLFQRPPFLIPVAFVDYPASLHPAPRPTNPWHDLLRKASYDPSRNELLLATADGFFRGPADGSEPLTLVRGGPPVSVMGATVLERRPDGLLWVGSMSGLYLWNCDTGWVTDAFTGAPPQQAFGPPVGEYAVVGLLQGDRSEPLAVDYFQGVLGAGGGADNAMIPVPLAAGGRMSLWHLLFEVHNGRIFGFLLGWWSWVVVPLGGAALVAEVLSGVVTRRRPKRLQQAIQDPLTAPRRG